VRGRTHNSWYYEMPYPKHGLKSLGCACRRFSHNPRRRTPAAGIRASGPRRSAVHEEARSYRGFNFFRPGRRSSLSGSGPRRVQSAARSVSPIQQRPDVPNSTQTADARTHQKGKPLLQVLPYGARRTGCRTRPQTQGARYHPSARCYARPLNILPISART